MTAHVLAAAKDVVDALDLAVAQNAGALPLTVSLLIPDYKPGEPETAVPVADAALQAFGPIPTSGSVPARCSALAGALYEYARVR